MTSQVMHRYQRGDIVEVLPHPQTAEGGTVYWNSVTKAVVEQDYDSTDVRNVHLSPLEGSDGGFGQQWVGTQYIRPWLDPLTDEDVEEVLASIRSSMERR